MNREVVDAYALGALGAVQGVFREYLPERPSHKAWAVIGAGVLAYEVLCKPNETLSEGFDDFVDKHPIAARIGVLAVAGHICNIIPEKYDIVHQAAVRLK